MVTSAVTFICYFPVLYMVTFRVTFTCGFPIPYDRDSYTVTLISHFFVPWTGYFNSNFHLSLSRNLHGYFHVLYIVTFVATFISDFVVAFTITFRVTFSLTPLYLWQLILPWLWFLTCFVPSGVTFAVTFKCEFVVSCKVTFIVTFVSDFFVSYFSLSRSLLWLVSQ